jgi:hypothetical protein
MNVDDRDVAKSPWLGNAARWIAVVTVVVVFTTLAAWHWRRAKVATRVARSTAGREVRWREREIVLTWTVENALEPPVLREAVLQAAEEWNRALKACSVPRLRVSSVKRPRAEVRRDGVTSVVVRRKRWCPEKVPDWDDCYEPTRAAITHLYPVDEPGARHAFLYEADVEFNGVHFAWSLDGEAPDVRSLRAVVMHELGHVLGLEHPCDERPGQGGSCGDGSLRTAVMYPFPVEVGRAPVLSPHPAEVDALCRLYAE